jgi:predicted nucleic acid-binding protein
MSGPSAVLDACVLVNACLRDTLLRLAEEPRLYIRLWSAEILEETARTLRGPNFGLTDVQVDRLLGRLRRAFPEATIEGYAHLIDAMLNAPGDRHVLAAAAKAGANVVVTFNIRHFPPCAADGLRIAVQKPDDFLLHHFRLAPELVVERLYQQAEAIHATIGHIMGRLDLAAPGFANLVRLRLKASA